MKKAALVFAMVLMTAACAFAGTYIESELSGPALAGIPGSKLLHKFYVQGAKVRIEAEVPGGTLPASLPVTIALVEEKKSYFIFPAQQTYMERPLESMMSPPEDFPSIKVEELGDAKTISGYQCSGYKVAVEDKGATCWFTKDLAADEGLKALWKLLSDTMPDEVKASTTKELSKLQGFPVMLEMTDGTTWVLKKFEKKEFDESLFAIPTGYQKMEMPVAPQPPGAR